MIFCSSVSLLSLFKCNLNIPLAHIKVRLLEWINDVFLYFIFFHIVLLYQIPQFFQFCFGLFIRMSMPTWYSCGMDFYLLPFLVPFSLIDSFTYVCFETFEAGIMSPAFFSSISAHKSCYYNWNKFQFCFLILLIQTLYSCMWRIDCMNKCLTW